METPFEVASFLALGFILGIPMGQILFVSGKIVLSKKKESLGDLLLLLGTLLTIVGITIFLVIVSRIISEVPEMILFAAVDFGVLVGIATGLCKSLLESRGKKGPD